MDKTLILVAILFALIGAYAAYHLIRSGYPLMETVQSIPSRIGALYYGIPESIRAVIPTATAVISLGFTTFFAWAKIQWQKKALEVEETATAKLNQVEGEKADIQAQLEASSAEGLKGLIAERNGAYAVRDEATALAANLKAENETLKKQYASINQSLTTVSSPSEAEMKRRLEQAGYSVKAKVA